MTSKIFHRIQFSSASCVRHGYLDRCIRSQEKFFSTWNQKIWTEEDFLNIVHIEGWEIPHAEKLLEIEAWAFISDIIRIYALYTEGGLYADWDVEFVNSMPEYLLNYELVLGFEPYTLSGVGTVQVGTQLCISRSNHELWKDIYKKISSSIWTAEFNILPGLCTRILEDKYSLVSPRNKSYYYYLPRGIVIVPNDVFYPFMGTRIFNQNSNFTETQIYNTIQASTVALHWEYSQMIEGTFLEDVERKKGWTNYLTRVRKNPQEKGRI